MTISILTLFPQIFPPIFEESILKRAGEKNLLKFNLVNIRDYANDSRKTVDDKPYGGGQGMVLKVDVLVSALESIKPKPYSILLSASGKKYTQKHALALSKKKHVAIICGHYEGIDARVEKFVDEVFSIGDFVLTGGEIAALVIVDSVTRLIPGVINPKSLESESYLSTTNYQLPTTLEFPQYTRPQTYKDLRVPKVLLSGNHSQISNWRQEQSLKRTKKFRPDLIKSKSILRRAQAFGSEAQARRDDPEFTEGSK